MAYDEKLADRVRVALARRAHHEERKMFGGLCFMVDGHMCCGIVDDRLMARVGAQAYDAALARPHTRPMDFTGRPLKGMVYVEPKGVRTAKGLERWIGECLAFVRAQPPKKAGARAQAGAATSKEGASKKRTAKDEVPRSFDGFKASTFRFLQGLRDHNDKAWFDAHRADYEAHYLAPALSFIEVLGPKLQKLSKTIHFEARINGSLFRIHRDVRFSKDKRPYKDHIDLWFWEGAEKGWMTPGFYFRLAPDELIVGAGVHRFSPPQLAAYRAAVIDGRTGSHLRRALESVVGGRGGYEMSAPTRKTVPRGFDRDHPRAGLLLHDGLSARWQGAPPRAARSAAFVDWCEKHYRAVLPVHRWLTKNVAPAG